MTLQQLKEKAMKELKEKFCVECPHGIRKGEIVLNPIYPKPIQDFIDSFITKAYEEGKREGKKAKYNLQYNNNATPMIMRDRVHQRIDTGEATYEGKPITTSKDWVEWNEYSPYDIFFGPSNYWEVMFPNNAIHHQIQYLLYTKHGGNIEEYLDHQQSIGRM